MFRVLTVVACFALGCGDGVGSHGDQACVLDERYDYCEIVYQDDAGCLQVCYYNEDDGGVFEPNQ